MYAVIKTGGKQYRVEKGQTLNVEILGASDDGSVSFGPFRAGPGPWSATIVSVGGNAMPDAGAPSVLSSAACPP